MTHSQTAKERQHEEDAHERIVHQQRRVERVQALVTMRLTTLALASVVSLALLTGCTGGDSMRPSLSGEPSLAQSPYDWTRNMSQCLQEKGWDVAVTPDGAIHMDLPQEQEAPYDEDHKTCEEHFGYDVAPVYTDDDVREIYAKVVATAGCIAEQGYDPGDPPSEQTFVEQVQSGTGGWDPYSDLYPHRMGVEEYYELIEKCPRTWV